MTFKDDILPIVNFLLTPERFFQEGDALNFERFLKSLLDMLEHRTCYVILNENLLRNDQVNNWINARKKTFPELQLYTMPSRPKTMDQLFETFASIFEVAKSARLLFHYWGDAPFMNIDANKEIFELQENYVCDYVFAEGYPQGITGSLLRKEILSSLIRDGRNVPLQRNGIFETIRININSYDIETSVSPEDLRMLRLTLFRDSQRNEIICKKLPITFEMGKEELCKVIKKNAGLYRSLPAFFAIQVSSKCPQSCSYCPVPKVFPNHRSSEQFLSIEQFTILMDKITNFVEDPVVSLSPIGEISLHPKIVNILERSSQYSSVRYLIETSGIAWTPEARSALAGLDRVDLILSLDSIDQDIYRKLRGEGFAEAMDFANWAESAIGNHFYVQAVRMQENEEHLLEFYQYWKKRNIQFIIQKYNDHSGFLSQRRVADLSPLKRQECWHVKRDMIIDIQGNVFACPNHCLDKKYTLSYGNLLTEDIDKIWKSGETLFAQHIHACSGINTPESVNGEKLPQICQSCDEWYTFNF